MRSIRTTDKVLHSVTVGVEPDAIAVAPGGTGDAGIALVANLDSNSVTPVDLGTWKAMTADCGRDRAGLHRRGGQRPEAGHRLRGRLRQQRRDTHRPGRDCRPASPIAVGPSPQTVAAAGLQVLVGNFGNSTLTPINAVTLQPGPPSHCRSTPPTLWSNTVGTTAYVTGGAALVPVTVATLALGTPVTLPDVAQGVALAGDGTAWVALQGGSLIAVDLATGAVGHRIHVGGHPSSVAIAPG